MDRWFLLGNHVDAIALREDAIVLQQRGVQDSTRLFAQPSDPLRSPDLVAVPTPRARTRRSPCRQRKAPFDVAIGNEGLKSNLQQALALLQGDGAGDWVEGRPYLLCRRLANQRATRSDLAVMHAPLHPHRLGFHPRLEELVGMTLTERARAPVDSNLRPLDAKQAKGAALRFLGHARFV